MEINQEIINDNHIKLEQELPADLKHFNWGAFFLNWLWAIYHKTWWGLLAFIPYVGIVVAIILGFKGNELAWKNKKWESVEEFKRVQKQWSTWGIVTFSIGLILGIIFSLTTGSFLMIGL